MRYFHPNDDMNSAGSIPPNLGALSKPRSTEVTRLKLQEFQRIWSLLTLAVTVLKKLSRFQNGETGVSPDFVRGGRCLSAGSKRDFTVTSGLVLGAWGA
jgi:hypothetical protein